MKTLHLIYKGNYITVKGTLGHAYFYVEENKTIHFKSKLTRFESVGTVVKSETENDSIFRNSKIIGQVSKDIFPEYLESIPEWSVENRSALQEHALIQTTKKTHPASIEHNVESIIKACGDKNFRERKKIALYVYTQILNG